MREDEALTPQEKEESIIAGIIAAPADVVEKVYDEIGS